MSCEVAISHSFSEFQSDESGEFAIFFRKFVAIATSLEISKGPVSIICTRRCIRCKDCENRSNGSFSEKSLIIIIIIIII